MLRTFGASRKHLSVPTQRTHSLSQRASFKKHLDPSQLIFKQDLLFSNKRRSRSSINQVNRSSSALLTSCYDSQDLRYGLTCQQSENLPIRSPWLPLQSSEWMPLGSNGCVFGMHLLSPYITPSRKPVHTGSASNHMVSYPAYLKNLTCPPLHTIIMSSTQSGFHKAVCDVSRVGVEPLHTLSEGNN